MNTRLTPATILTLLLLAGCGGEPAKPIALEVPFGRVQSFAFPNGMVGFWDQENGKVYVYDQQLTKCVAIRRMDRLGEELVKLQPER